jgi:hypothetical protein
VPETRINTANPSHSNLLVVASSEVDSEFDRAAVTRRYAPEFGVRRYRTTASVSRIWLLVATSVAYGAGRGRSELALAAVGSVAARGLNPNDHAPLTRACDQTLRPHGEGQVAYTRAVGTCHFHFAGSGASGYGGGN